MKYLFLWPLLLIMSEAMADAYYPFTNTLKQKGREIRVGGDGRKSSSRFDVDGKKTPFQTGEGFSMLQGELGISYGLTDYIQFTLGARGRSVASGVTATSATTESTVLTKSGLESAFAMIKISSPWWKNVQVAAEAYYRGVAYSNPAYDATNPNKFIILGEGSGEGGAAALMSYKFGGSSYFNFRLGYRKPASDLSAETLAQGELALASKSFAFLMGAEKVTSLGKDPYTSDPQSKPAKGTGSTYYFNSINRGWLSPYIGINWEVTPGWRVEAKGMTTVSGVSTDQMQTFMFSIVYRKEDTSSSRKAKEKDQDFKDYSIEGEVTKVGEGETLVLISVGLEQGVEKGMNFDLFDDDYKGGSKLIASGYAVKVGAQATVLKITEKIRKEPLKKGLTVRGGK